MILYAGANGFLDDVPVEKVRAFESAFQRFMDASHPDIGRKIAETKDVDSETETALKQAIDEFEASRE